MIILSIVLLAFAIACALEYRHRRQAADLRMMLTEWQKQLKEGDEIRLPNGKIGRVYLATATVLLCEDEQGNTTSVLRAGVYPENDE